MDVAVYLVTPFKSIISARWSDNEAAGKKKEKSIPSIVLLSRSTIHGTYISGNRYF